jgi:hypothetical protein
MIASMKETTTCIVIVHDMQAEWLMTTCLKTECSLQLSESGGFGV